MFEPLEHPRSYAASPNADCRGLCKPDGAGGGDKVRAHVKPNVLDTFETAEKRQIGLHRAVEFNSEVTPDLTNVAKRVQIGRVIHDERTVNHPPALIGP